MKQKKTRETKKLKERSYRGEHKNLTSHISHLTSDPKGITLIALVITIIVMLILVAVTINIVAQGKLFNYAGNAIHDTENAMKTENEMVDGKVTIGDTTYNSIDEAVEALTEDRLKVTVTGESDEETIRLTADNVADYLGKKVKNYIGQPSVAIGRETYNVSTEYRLYYVDFEGKYGEKGTIYLKAECTSNMYPIPTTAPKATDTVKIQNLNPGLYNAEDEDGMPISGSTLNPPPDGNDNMKAVKWLTNTNNWKDLKPLTYSSGIKDTDINYIVGAPSLEMMMDSYNTHYKLTGDEVVTTSDLQNKNDVRAKLYYQYPYNSNNYGYGVRSADKTQFSTVTSNYSVKTDTIDTMYYPRNGLYYWLASPSASLTDSVMRVSYYSGGNVGDCHYYYDRAFCPLVSLKSSVSLTLE